MLQPPQKQPSQPGSRTAMASSRGCSTHQSQTLQTALREGGPRAEEMGTPAPSSRQRMGRGIVPAVCFLLARMHREGLPA